MIVVDADTTRMFLTEVVNEAGRDHEVETCTYLTTDDEGKVVPNCIVGRVAAKFVSVEALLKGFGTTSDAGLNTAPISTTGAARAFAMAGLRFEMGAIRVLNTAQRVQDGMQGENKSWGSALDRALAY